jgi:hypothetical protein
MDFLDNWVLYVAQMKNARVLTEVLNLFARGLPLGCQREQPLE